MADFSIFNRPHSYQYKKLTVTLYKAVCQRALGEKIFLSELLNLNLYTEVRKEAISVLPVF